MKFNNVVIEDIAYVIPPEEVTSDTVEQKLSPLYERLKLPFGRLELMTGIKSRFHWEPNTLPSQASTLAGEKLLEKASFDKNEVDILIHSSVCRDKLEPATASYVHRNLGLGNDTQILDVSNACLGFLNAMILGAGMIDSGQCKRVLIVSGENGRPLLEQTIKSMLADDSLTRKTIKPYFANLTIGSGAVAATLCHKSICKKPKATLDVAVVETNTSFNHLCEGDQAGDNSLVMQTDSEELLKAGILVANKAWGKFKLASGWNEQTADTIITHQVGKAHRNLLYQNLNLSVDKDFSSFETLGNTGSVALPITLALAIEQGKFQPNNKAALLGIGSGLSSIMMSLQF